MTLPKPALVWLACLFSVMLLAGCQAHSTHALEDPARIHTQAVQSNGHAQGDYAFWL